MKEIITFTSGQVGVRGTEVDVLPYNVDIGLLADFEYFRRNLWKGLHIPASFMTDEPELTLEDDDDDGEDVFDTLDEVVETIDDLFDILEEFLNDGADIYIGTIPTIGKDEDESKPEPDTDAYDRAMKGMK
jgi:hypothetical protein